jgi:hypothetical protein
MPGSGAGRGHRFGAAPCGERLGNGARPVIPSPGRVPASERQSFSKPDRDDPARTTRDPLMHRAGDAGKTGRTPPARLAIPAHVGSSSICCRMKAPGRALRLCSFPPVRLGSPRASRRGSPPAVYETCLREVVAAEDALCAEANCSAREPTYARCSCRTRGFGGRAGEGRRDASVGSRPSPDLAHHGETPRVARAYLIVARSRSCV